MRQDDRGWPDKPTELSAIKGMIVAEATFCNDEKGYPGIAFRFTDGSTMVIRETGQCGSIEFEVNVKTRG